MSDPPQPPRQRPPGLSEPEAAYVITPSEREFFVDERMSRLDELLDQHLGRDIDRGTRISLQQIMAGAARQQHDLLEAADRGEVPADVYLERFTALLRRMFAELDGVLGRAAFERVFGAAPDDALGIIDPEVYARMHGLPRRL